MVATEEMRKLPFGYHNANISPASHTETRLAEIKTHVAFMGHFLEITVSFNSILKVAAQGQTNLDSLVLDNEKCHFTF